MPQKPKYEIENAEAIVKDVGENIASLRKLRGWTQNELAEKIGISQRLISHFEQGKRRMTIEMLIQFANALKVSADEILGLQTEILSNEKPSLRIIRRLKEIQTLPETQQRTILKSLDMMINSAK